MTNKSVVKIIIGIFCLTWLMWGSIIIANHFGSLKFGTPLSMVLFIIGALAPALVPVTFILKNKVMPAKQLFRTVFSIKQQLASYLMLASFMALLIIVGIISGLFTPFSPVYLLMLPVLIFVGGLEEVGWRFVLQSALEKKFPFILTSVIIAVIWALWHLPLFFIEGRIQYDWNFGLYSIFLLGLAFANAAIYRLTKSVWLCVLFHAFASVMFEDSSLIIRFGSFYKDFVPVFITSTVLIATSIFIVRFPKSKESGAFLRNGK